MPRKSPWQNVAFGHLRDTEMARDVRYKLVLRRGGAGPNEFYDLRNDPREAVNQYDNAEFVTVREPLAKVLAQWREQYAAGAL